MYISYIFYIVKGVCMLNQATRSQKKLRNSRCKYIALKTLQSIKSPIVMNCVHLPEWKAKGFFHYNLEKEKISRLLDLP